MKTLIILSILTISSSSFAACSINLGVKKVDAKSAKLAGVSFSAKQIEALKTICTVELNQMNDSELVEDFKASLKRKHDRDAKKEASL